MYKPVVMTNDDYHNESSNSSTNVRAILDCDKKYLASLGSSNKAPSKAMLEGTAVHAYLGEPELFEKDFICKPVDLSLRTKEGKQWVLDNSDKIVLDNEFFNNLPLIAESFYDSPAKDIYKKNGLVEKSFFWKDDYGVPCKCRPDWISPDFRSMIDLKTTIDANPKKFKYSISQYKYDIQAAFYMRGVEVCTKVTPETFYFIAIEKVAPFCVGVYQISSEWLIYVEKEIHEALYRIDSLKQRGKPFDYTPEILELQPPAWMKEKTPQAVPMEEIKLF